MRGENITGVRCDTVFYEFPRRKVGITQNSINTWDWLIAYTPFKCMATKITALSSAVSVESRIPDSIADVAVENIEHAIGLAGQPISTIAQFKSQFLRWTKFQSDFRSLKILINHIVIR